MKVLFISSRDIDWKSNGGELCTNRNYTSFVKILGKSNVLVKNLMFCDRRDFTYPLKKRYNFLFGYNEGISNPVLKEILTISKDFSLVFIDTSLYGVIAGYLKKRGYKGKIVVFFHNVEFQVKFQRFLSNPLKLTEVLLAYYNERIATKYADEIVTLTDLDLMELKKLYRKTFKAKIIPISLMDRYNGGENTHKTTLPPKFLFIGNDWYANIHGLRWFVRNVLKHVNIRLQITGKGMEKYKKEFSDPKIEISGFVPNLDKVLIDADYIISPIFKGGGMKVKTCEALMFGKNIIGTKESFLGYDLDFDKAGAICNTAMEFIDKIGELSKEKKYKYNKYNREIFLQKYSFVATLNCFIQLLDN